MFTLLSIFCICFTFIHVLCAFCTFSYLKIFYKYIAAYLFKYIIKLSYI